MTGRRPAAKATECPGPWPSGCWPGVDPIVELPVARILGNGRGVAGRTDLVLRTPTGWIVFDRKSTPQGNAQWEEVAQKRTGQLAAYQVCSRP